MIFLVNNSTKYFFPIFLINYRGELDLFSLLILSVELSGYFWATLITIRGCWVIYNTRVFHWNLNAYCCGCYFQWFEIFIGKLMVGVYHKGWIILEGNDPSKTYSEFYTTDISQMPKISSLWDYPFLTIGMLLIAHYYTFAILSLTGLTIERCCATYWINDYETKKRPWITIFIFISLELLSVFIVFLGTNLYLNVYYWIIMAIIILVVNVLSFFYIFYWNIRIHKILETIQNLPKRYTLQARFQAKENARSLSILKCIVVVVTLCILVESSFFVVQWTQTLKKYEVPFFYLLGFMNSQNPVTLVTLAMITVPRWRRRFFAPLSFVPGVKKYLLKDNMISVVEVIRPTSSTINQETEEYFSQLRNAWA